MIDPTTIDLEKLPWLSLAQKNEFPQKPAIYFAIDSLGNVQYIGRAKNLYNRWAGHHRYSQLNALGE